MGRGQVVQRFELSLQRAFTDCNHIHDATGYIRIELSELVEQIARPNKVSGLGYQYAAVSPNSKRDKICNKKEIDFNRLQDTRSLIFSLDKK